jgi:hypothetical protein
MRGLARKQRESDKETNKSSPFSSHPLSLSLLSEKLVEMV